MYRTLNPTTEELLTSFELHTDADVERALAASTDAFASWRRASFSERAKVFRAAASLLEQRQEAASNLISLEMGKPISQARFEVARCRAACTYFADNAEIGLQAEIRELASGGQGEVCYEALGPLLAIMPWNFPFYQVFRFVCPAMMAGNTVVMKHAPNTPACAEFILSLFNDAGFPEGCFQSLRLSNEQVEKVIADRRICGVSLTGSAQAGSAVAAQAGRHLKPSLLELGGNDPFLVLASANVQKAAKHAAASRCLNAGQVCCSAKRFIIERSVAKEFTELFLDEMDAQKLGNPLDESVTMGPLAREDLREKLREQVAGLLRTGAKVLTEQSPPVSKGFFFGPIVFEGVSEEYLGFDQELFGPVACLYTVDSEEEAIALSNSSRFGLSASIWSEDSERAKAVATRLDSGTVMINATATSDFAMPFGGVKNSGFGRELGLEGLRSFVNTKAIVAKT